MKSKKPTVSEEDKALFRSYIGKVERLKYPELAIKPQKTLFKKHPANQAPIPFQVPLYDRENPVTAEESLYFNRAGLQQKVQRKFKRGQLPTQAELDLHGFTVAQAYQELMTFLECCESQNIRHIRVIHGKGYSAQNDYPILKNKVNNWLRDHSQVLAFSSAIKNDGGAGVLYVLLRAKDKL